MNALSVLEPRVAGEELIDPDVEFRSDGGGDGHLRCPCNDATAYPTDILTFSCINSTKNC